MILSSGVLSRLFEHHLLLSHIWRLVRIWLSSLSSIRCTSNWCYLVIVVVLISKHKTLILQSHALVPLHLDVLVHLLHLNLVHLHLQHHLLLEMQSLCRHLRVYHLRLV